MEPVPTDFWGVVVPSWLGAVASIAASTVAVIAFINSLSAKGGVTEIGDALNREPSVRRGAIGGLAIGGAATGTDPPEPWAVERDRRVGIFRNTSGRCAVVSGIDVVGGVHAALDAQLPLEVPPTASFEVRLRRDLGGPAVRGVTLRWTDGDGRQASRIYYL